MLDTIRSGAQSWGVRIIFLIIIVVFVFWGVGNFSGGSVGEVAEVNGERISLVDYQQALQAAAASEMRNSPDLMSNEAKQMELKRLTLDRLIVSRLRLQEAARLGIIVTPHELRKARDSYESFQDASGKFDENRYRAILQKQGMTPDQFLTELEKDILENKLVSYVGISALLSEAEAKRFYDFTLEKRVAEYVLFDAEAYAAKAEISDAELAEYYEKNKESFRLPIRAKLEYLSLNPDTLVTAFAVSDTEAETYYKANSSLFSTPDMYQARHIFIPAPTEDETGEEAEKERAAAEATVAEIMSKLKAGGDFSALAKKYSKDNETANIGGMMPMLERGKTGLDALDDAAFALEPGQVGEPFRSAVGFHILKLESKRAASVKPFAEVKESIKTLLAREKATDGFTAIEKTAEEGLATGTDFATIGAPYKVTPQTSELAAQDSLYTALGLHSDSRQLLDDAVVAASQDGKTPSTVPVPLNTGTGIVLVRVLEARPSEVPSMESLKDDIVKNLRASKGGELARKAAEEALPSFTGSAVPAAFAGKTQKTTPTIRVASLVPPLGTAEPLVNALFSATNEVWFPEIFETPKGTVIARLASVAAQSDADWERDKAFFVPQISQARIVESSQAFLQELLGKSKIKAYEEALQRINWKTR